MNYFWLLLHVLVSPSIAMRYGILRQTQLMSFNASIVQLENLSSLSQCLCRSQWIESMKIVALNYFSNGTCQMFGNEFSSRTKFYLTNFSSSRVILLDETFLKRIQSICCANAPWVVTQLQRADTFRNVSIQEPYSFTMDPDRRLIFVTYQTNTSPYQQVFSVGSFASGRNSIARTRPQPALYHDGFYYVGTDPGNSTTVSQWYIYNSTLNRFSNISFPQGTPQRAVWLANSSLMSVIVRRGRNSTLLVVNWLPSVSPFYYTLNRSIPIPVTSAYGLAKSPDDSFLYVTGDSTTIYQLSTRTWIWSILVPSNNASGEIITALAVDSCGERLWVLFSGFGLRIYDRSTGDELAAWDLSSSYPTLVDMILTDDYELYLLDSSMSQMVHVGLSLKDQCPFI